jgi:hypothetical protein
MLSTSALVFRQTFYDYNMPWTEHVPLLGALGFVKAISTSFQIKVSALTKHQIGDHPLSFKIFIEPVDDMVQTRNSAVGPARAG